MTRHGRSSRGGKGGKAGGGDASSGKPGGHRRRAASKARGPKKGVRKPGRSGKKAALEHRILELLDASPGGRPVAQRALARRLGLQANGGRRLARLLDELVRSGRAIDAGQGRFKRARRDGLIEGRVTALHGDRARDDGASIVDGSGRVWRVPRASEAGVGDRVLVQPIGAADAARGELVRAIGGARDRVIGILERGRGHAEVTPYRDDAYWRIKVSERDLAGAKAGEVVEVERIDGLETHAKPSGRERHASHDMLPTGRVVERIGRPGSPEADFRAVVWHRRLPVEFSPKVLSELDGVPGELPQKAFENRRDLRDRPFMTIDPATARDHDDAVFVESGPDGGDWLWVAIADVAHYVRPGTALDREAERRGNSVYFPDRAIPMLPDRLSGDLCSLRPDTDRLAMVVRLWVDAEGRVHRPEFFEAVIRSHAKLAYEEAAAILESGGRWGTVFERPPETLSQVRELGGVAKRLQRRRKQHGALDFELPEPVVKLDERGRVLDIVRSERSDAHRAIEEAMLAANRAVAQMLVGDARPTIHRVHEPPDEEALDELRQLFGQFGLLETARPRIGVRELQQALESACGHRAERLVHTRVLRAMKQARYGAVSQGHFALAFEAYLHFTSPIRRYADLVVHRALKARLRGHPPARADALAHLAARLSALERRAVAAERDMLDLKKAALMAGRLGERFEGVVTGAAEQGLYVTLDRPFVEGLVHARGLPSTAAYDAERQSWRTGRGDPGLGIGERVEVQLIGVDPLKGWVNFRLIRGEEAPDDSGKAGGKAGDKAVRKERPRARPVRGKAVPSRGRGRRSRS